MSHTVRHIADRAGMHGTHTLGTVNPARLHRDWEQLRHDRGALHRAAGWQLVSGPLVDLEQILRLTGRAVSDASREAVLHRLLALASEDVLAARILLRRIEPELLLVHRRRRRQAWALQLDVGLGDLLTTAWTVIRTYNPERRPVRIVSSLVSDVEYREYRAPFRRIGHGHPADPGDFDRVEAAPVSDPTIELAALVSDPAVRLDPADRDLVRRLMSGRQAVDIARELGVTPRTVRNRRDRIALRLREVAIAA